METEGNKWITTYIFPGGYLPTLREELNIAADINFRTLDVESLRLHYMKTLEAVSYTHLDVYKRQLLLLMN